MRTINAHLIGRFGNMLFQYAYARKYAEINNLELRTNDWPGRHIFDQVKERPMIEGGDRLEDDYRQRQSDLIYTREDIERWFRINPDFTRVLQSEDFPLAHRRVGDFAYTPGYPVISKQSYHNLALRCDIPFIFVSDECPSFNPRLPYDWLQDFIRMVYAPILMRGNSSFSWWAATLNEVFRGGKIFAPIIDGVMGSFDNGIYVERDVEFTAGNWPRLANHEFTTNLILA